MFSTIWKRRFRSFPSLSDALYAKHYAIDDWREDIPIAEDELDILQSHFLELLPELNELEN